MIYNCLREIRMARRKRLSFFSELYDSGKRGHEAVASLAVIMTWGLSDGLWAASFNRSKNVVNEGEWAWYCNVNKGLFDSNSALSNEGMKGRKFLEEGMRTGVLYLVVRHGVCLAWTDRVDTDGVLKSPDLIILVFVMIVSMMFRQHEQFCVLARNEKIKMNDTTGDEKISWSYWKAWEGYINQTTLQSIVLSVRRTRTGEEASVAFLVYISTQLRIVHFSW